MEKLIGHNWADIPVSWSDILDASHNGIVIINRDGVILLYNKAARKMLGNEAKSPVGRHFAEIRPETWGDLKSILESGEPQVGKK